MVEKDHSPDYSAQRHHHRYRRVDQIQGCHFDGYSDRNHISQEHFRQRRCLYGKWLKSIRQQKIYIGNQPLAPIKLIFFVQEEPVTESPMSWPLSDCPSYRIG